MKITERESRPPGDYDREKWRRPVGDFEWLEDHCWVLPPEERGLGIAAKDVAIEREKPKADKPPENLTASRLREAIDLGVRLAEEEALFKLTMKARQVRAAEIERRRPHLIGNTTLQLTVGLSRRRTRRQALSKN